jgi:hypothetical protein
MLPVIMDLPIHPDSIARSNPLVLEGDAIKPDAAEHRIPQQNDVI